VYQIVWLRQLTLLFGATAHATSAILSTFMGGLALGSYWAGRKADHWGESPLRTYGKLELAIAAYAALVPWLLAGTTPLLEAAWRMGADRHFALLGVVKFIAIAILILPATTLMGATLPVLSRFAARQGRSLGGGVGALYAINTLGAVFGTLACAFAVLPALGMRRTMAATVAVNALVGCIAWLAGRGGAETRDAGDAGDAEGASAPGTPQKALILGFAASGFAAMVLEVAWTRGLALVLGSSVYAYASMLTAFLLGLASGAGSAARFLERRRGADARVVLSIVLAAAGAFSFLAAYVIQGLPRLFAEIYFRSSPSPQGWWGIEIGIALLIMFPTTYALGWVFPLVLEAAGAGRRAVAASVGRIYAANTVGTIVGAATGGFVLIPWVGVGATLVGVAALQLLLGAALAPASAHGTALGKRVLAGACLGGALLCAVFPPKWDVLMMNSGVYMNVQNGDRAQGWAGFRQAVRTNNEAVYAKDGLTASVLVARQPVTKNMYLAVNGKTEASTRSDLETQLMVGHIPLLLHDAPKDVLVIGLASGITVGAVATHDVERIRIVEVEGAMLEAARMFAEFNGRVLDDPRVTVSINDARNELQFNPNTFDVVISEPSNPWMTVASNLFTEDFFRIAKARLRPGGLYGQWVQAYCLAPRQLRSILAAFRRTFPHVIVFEAGSGVDLIFVGSDRPLSLDTELLDRKMSELWVKTGLARARIRSAVDLIGMIQTGERAVDPLVRDATVNSDDNGFVEFGAPKTLYIESIDANLAMLQGSAPDPVDNVLPLIRTRMGLDELRLELIRRWVRRDQKDRAKRAIPFFAETAMKAQAQHVIEKK